MVIVVIYYHYRCYYYYYFHNYLLIFLISWNLSNAIEKCSLKWKCCAWQTMMYLKIMHCWVILLWPAVNIHSNLRMSHGWEWLNRYAGMLSHVSGGWMQCTFTAAVRVWWRIYRANMTFAGRVHPPQRRQSWWIQIATSVAYEMFISMSYTMQTLKIKSGNNNPTRQLVLNFEHVLFWSLVHFWFKVSKGIQITINLFIFYIYCSHQFRSLFS